MRGADLYSSEAAAAGQQLYDNNPGNRRGLAHILAQQYATKTQSLYSDPGPGYKLDTATEPEPNISWEPFTSPAPAPAPVSSAFISHLAGYGYNTGDQRAVVTVPSTKL